MRLTDLARDVPIDTTSCCQVVVVSKPGFTDAARAL